MIHDKLQRLGSWGVTLNELPTDVLNRLEYFGRVLVIKGLVTNPEEHTAADLAAMARYGGILRHRKVHREDPASVTLSGPGMAMLLGDEDTKGPVIESETVDNETYADAINDLVTAKLADGDLHLNTGGSVTTPGGAPNVSATFAYQTLREAVDYLAGLVDAYWRVNPDATLDTGPQSALFTTDPTTVITRRAALQGGSLEARAAQGKLVADLAADDYTTKVLLVGEVDGSTLVSATDEAVSFPYTGPDGNAYKVTRMIRETGTDATNAAARAGLQLNRYNRTRRGVTLSSATHDISGRLAPGDQVLVYDPDTGLVGSEELDHQGQLITPLELQVTGLSWPVHEGHTVVYVHGDGTVTDLTAYVAWETGDTQVEVGEYNRTLADGAGNPVAASVADATGELDSIAPDQVTLGTILTGTYRGPEGVDLAYLIVPWTQPTNTDATAITDGSHYEVQYRETGGSDWRSTFVGWGVLSAELQALATNTQHDVRVRAVDTSGNQGAWSTTSVIFTGVDSVAPSTPAAPSVAGDPLSILVTHDLTKAATGALEEDTALLEVHVGTTSGFTPDASSLVGEIPVGGALQAGISVVGSFPTFTDATRHVKVIAVDRAGNRSAASASASVTAELIQNVHILDATIESAKIADLEVNKLIAGSGFVVALTVAAGGSIESANFVTGPAGTGYRLTDTLAEFNDVTVRGTLDAVTGSLDDLAIDGDLTMASTGAVKSSASGHRAEFTGATTSTTVIGGAKDYAGLDLFSGSVNETEAGLVGIDDGTVGPTSAAVVFTSPDLGNGKEHIHMSAGTTANELRVHSQDRLYLTAGPNFIDMYATSSGVTVRGGLAVEDDSGTSVAIFTDVSPDGGEFGSLHLRDGVGDGGYEGVNIHGEFVFMWNGTDGGIYWDQGNDWILRMNDVTDYLRLNAPDSAEPVGLQLSAASATGQGSAGDGYVVLNDELGGFTGTAAHLTTTTIDGYTGKRIGFMSSKSEGKDDMRRWELTDEAYQKIRPTSFLVKDVYVDDLGRHHHWDPDRARPDGTRRRRKPPKDWMPLRRYGLVWEDLMAEPELWSIATELSWDAQALSAANTAKVQGLLERVAALEAAAT